MCRMIRAAVFDLDDTLVDTSCVRAARDRADWAEVGRRLHEAIPFQVARQVVHEIPGVLRERGLKIGVLTHAPRWYAETLLTRFGVRPHVLVTGSDGYPRKPDPTSLKVVIDQLGVDVDEAVYVGDLHSDAGAAAGAGALSVGARWAETDAEDWRRWWPDVAISRPSLLLDLDRLDQLRPIAEARLRGAAPEWHWGTVMRVGRDVRACGRYFTPEDVGRFPHDPLSNLVLRAKDDPAAAEEVAALFAAFAEWPGWGRSSMAPQVVVSVPPKPGAEFDRLAASRAAMAAALGARDAPDALEMLFDVPNYKQLPPDERAAANADRFRSGPLEGERVLLLDDVLTTGSQTTACRDALLAAGAGWVGIVALAAAQDRLPEACPVCGGTLRVRSRHSDGHQFIGCSNYHALGCTYTRDL